jgi:hypothetical protein
VSGPQFKVIAGKLADAESMVAAKDLFNRLGSGSLWHEGGFADLSADLRASYVANTTVAGLEGTDVVLLVGTNPRVEAPVYNARLRKAFLDGTRFGLVGEAVDLTYAYDYLGPDAAALASIKRGTPFFDALKGAKRPVVIVGPGVLNRWARRAGPWGWGVGGWAGPGGVRAGAPPGRGRFWGRAGGLRRSGQPARPGPAALRRAPAHPHPTPRPRPGPPPAPRPPPPPGPTATR